MYNQKYKRPFQTIKDGPVTGKTGFLHVKSFSLSLSLPLLFRLNSHLGHGGSLSLITCPGF